MSSLNKKTKKELFIEVLNDPDRKSLSNILLELLSLTYYYKVIPKHYFSNYLFKNTTKNIRDYIPSKFLEADFKLFFNDYSHKEILENKLFFDLYFSQFNLKLPEVVIYNHKNIFIIDKNQHKVENISDFKELLSVFFVSNLSIQSLIIKKSYKSYGGDKIYKVDHDLVTHGIRDISELYNEIIKAGFLFQKIIKQHQKLDELNPSCLNTIRFETFININGEIEIISAFIRMSISNSYVDNASRGGCMVGIDIASGALNEIGFQVFRWSGVKVLKNHPITRVKFKNFVLPFFDQARELVLKAASHAPAMRLLGWDVGISENGPVLIEGNSWYNSRGNNLTTGGYASNAIFRKVLLEFNEGKR